jgi:hypothetical protein
MTIKDLEPEKLFSLLDSKHSIPAGGGRRWGRPREGINWKDETRALSQGGRGANIMNVYVVHKLSVYSVKQTCTYYSVTCT